VSRGDIGLDPPHARAIPARYAEPKFRSDPTAPVWTEAYGGAPFATIGGHLPTRGDLRERWIIEPIRVRHLAIRWDADLGGRKRLGTPLFRKAV